MKAIWVILSFLWCVALNGQHTTPLWGWGDLKFSFGTTTTIDTGFCYNSARTSAGGPDGGVMLMADGQGVYNASGVKLAEATGVSPVLLPMGQGTYAVLYGNRYLLCRPLQGYASPLCYIDSVTKPFVKHFQHANLRDWWLVAPGVTSDSLDIYLLTEGGVVRHPSFSYTDGTDYIYSGFNPSYSGHYCAIWKYRSLTSGKSQFSQRLDVLSFDNHTGTFAFYNNIFQVDTAYDALWSLVFTPNDSFLYIRQANAGHKKIGPYEFTRFNIHATDPCMTKLGLGDIAAYNAYSAATALGPDGSLYYFRFMGLPKTHGQLMAIHGIQTASPNIISLTRVAAKWPFGCMATPNWSKNMPLPAICTTWYPEDIGLIKAADTAICEKEKIPLNVEASQYDSVLWNTGATTPSITAGVGTYFYHVYLKGMTLSDTITIEEEDQGQCAFTVYIPNSFSPNGNGDNDRFFISWSDVTRVAAFDIIIYNRWGQEVFHSTDPSFTWSGQDAHDGIYYYTLKITRAGNATRQDKGTIYIIK